MNKFIFIILFGLLSPLFAFAQGGGGDRVGNGGTGALCNNRVFFYDLYELTRVYKKDVFVPEDLNWREKRSSFEIAKAILARQSNADESFKKLVRTYLGKFQHDHILHETWRDDFIRETHDNPEPIYKAGCKPVQIASSEYVTRDNFSVYTYNINKKLWNQMDLMNRATLMLHEVIYRIAFDKGHQTSVGVKRIVQAMLVDNSKFGRCYLLSLRQFNNMLLPNENMFTAVDGRTYSLDKYAINSGCEIKGPIY